MEPKIQKKAENYQMRQANQGDLPSVEQLWRTLYEYQYRRGMLLMLPENSFQQWAISLKPLLRRFACLFIGEKDGEPVGFLAGRVRSLPSYFGGRTTRVHQRGPNIASKAWDSGWLQQP